jgi:hypothetical protein
MRPLVAEQKLTRPAATPLCDTGNQSAPQIKTCGRVGCGPGLGAAPRHGREPADQLAVYRAPVPSGSDRSCSSRGGAAEEGTSYFSGPEVPFPFGKARPARAKPHPTYRATARRVSSRDHNGLDGVSRDADAHVAIAGGAGSSAASGRSPGVRPSRIAQHPSFPGLGYQLCRPR